MNKDMLIKFAIATLAVVVGTWLYSKVASFLP